MSMGTSYAPDGAGRPLPAAAKRGGGAEPNLKAMVRLAGGVCQGGSMQ